MHRAVLAKYSLRASGGSLGPFPKLDNPAASVRIKPAHLLYVYLYVQDL